MPMADVSLTQPRGIGDWLRICRLYRSAFPRSERKPFGIIAGMYRRGKTDLWCIRDGKAFGGFAATVNSPDIILLDYLAILPVRRKQGLGSAALKQLRLHYPEKALFVEIESTADSADPLRLRRKQFYQSAGMVSLGVSANVFGVPMELLGWNCALDFAGYQSFYRDHYSPWAAEHILPL